MKVAIIGFGWVGKSMQKLFPDTYIYDNNLGMGNIEYVNECDIAFICVPSPCHDKGELDTSIIDSVVKWCECSLLVMRSTVNPGTCNFLSKKYHKRIVMQPEYLGETVAHPMYDPKTRQFIIIGGDPNPKGLFHQLSYD